MYDAQKKYKKNNIKRITMDYKISDFENIESIAIDNNIKTTTLIKIYVQYCIDNNIDISTYLKWFYFTFYNTTRYHPIRYIIYTII